MKTSKTYETKAATFCLHNASTILIKFKNDMMVTLADSVELDKAIAATFPDDYYYIIDTLGIDSNMNTEALNYFAKQSEIGKNTLGAAVLLNNLAIRLTTSAFITFYKPIFPTKIFKDYGSAENWLKKIQQRVG